MAEQQNIFEKTIPQLVEWKQGDVANQVDMLNQPIKALNDLRNGAALPERVQKQQQVQAAVGVEFEWLNFRIWVTVNNLWDAIACRRDGDPNDILVALPWLLRQSSWDSRFVGRSKGFYHGVASGDSRGRRRSSTVENISIGVENEKIVQPYGDLNTPDTPERIFAAKIDTGVDGVEWLDMNIDARAWAKDSQS